MTASVDLAAQLRAATGLPWERANWDHMAVAPVATYARLVVGDKLQAFVAPDAGAHLVVWIEEGRSILERVEGDERMLRASRPTTDISWVAEEIRLMNALLGEPLPPDPAAGVTARTQAEHDVLTERAQQRAKWPGNHDEGHSDLALAAVAAHLVCPPHATIWTTEADQKEDAVPPGERLAFTVPAPGWGRDLRKKCGPDRRRRLVIAAALLLAEIDRLDAWEKNPRDDLKSIRLKTWPTSFQAILDGTKAYEVRSTKDRQFLVGDLIWLEEWAPRHDGDCLWVSDYDEQQTSNEDIYCQICKRKKYAHGSADPEPLPGMYTGRQTLVQVTYLTPGGRFGVPEGMCVLGIRRLA